MRVAVICEFSGVVRQAFCREGQDAYSVDLLDAEDSSRNHWKIDARQMPESFWETCSLAICHPPCTYLAVSGARWFKDRQREQAEAIEFVKWCWELPIPHIAIENPIGVLSTKWRKPDQIIQPWMFGHGETKATCLWLKNLPLLKPTNIVDGRVARVHRASPGPDRWKERSRTLPGIAAAMAEQWGAP